MYFNDLTDLICKKISIDPKDKNILIIAIDGRCTSGKTTLAKELSERLGCNVIHTDDFYLQSSQRTEERYAEPGGNLDRERLKEEILLPLKNGQKPVYRPFLCSSLSFGPEIKLPDKKIYIIEGSYSCHPELSPFYDMTVFVTTNKETQEERIINRNGKEKLDMFRKKWIPLEESYFDRFAIKEKADIITET